MDAVNITDLEKLISKKQHVTGMILDTFNKDIDQLQLLKWVKESFLDHGTRIVVPYSTKYNLFYDVLVYLKFWLVWIPEHRAKARFLDNNKDLNWEEVKKRVNII